MSLAIAAVASWNATFWFLDCQFWLEIEKVMNKRKMGVYGPFLGYQGKIRFWTKFYCFNYYGTHSFVIFAPHGELWRFVAPHGATLKCVKFWRNVAHCSAYKIKSWRQMAPHFIKKKKKIAPHIATFRYISPLGMLKS